MAKIYFAVLNGARVVTALLDLENPPAGVTSEIVAHPWQQGVDIGHYLLEDMDRTLACLAELASDSLGPTSKEFSRKWQAFGKTYPLR